MNENEEAKLGLKSDLYDHKAFTLRPMWALSSTIASSVSKIPGAQVTSFR